MCAGGSVSKGIADQMWCAHPVPVSLVICLVLRFFLTAFAITLPVPAGVYMPLLAMGATMGRLVGCVRGFVCVLCQILVQT
jgi:H+/Cl- antiporter ClcA